MYSLQYKNATCISISLRYSSPWRTLTPSQSPTVSVQWSTSPKRKLNKRSLCLPHRTHGCCSCLHSSKRCKWHHNIQPLHLCHPWCRRLSCHPARHRCPMVSTAQAASMAWMVALGPKRFHRAGGRVGFLQLQLPCLDLFWHPISRRTEMFLIVMMNWSERIQMKSHLRVGIKRKKLQIGSTARNSGEAVKHLVIGSTVPIARLVGGAFCWLQFHLGDASNLGWTRVLSEIENREGVWISLVWPVACVLAVEYCEHHAILSFIGNFMPRIQTCFFGASKCSNHVASCYLYQFLPSLFFSWLCCVYVFPLVEGVLGLPSKVFHCGPKLVVLVFFIIVVGLAIGHSGCADISEFATVENIWFILIYYDFIPPEKELIFGQWNVQFLDDLTRRSLTIFYRPIFVLLDLRWWKPMLVGSDLPSHWLQQTSQFSTKDCAGHGTCFLGTCRRHPESKGLATMMKRENLAEQQP